MILPQKNSGIKILALPLKYVNKIIKPMFPFDLNWLTYLLSCVSKNESATFLHLNC